MANHQMLPTLHVLFWFFATAPLLCYASGPTPIYIDLVPGYKSLSPCAEAPLSIIIRDMVKGCGDGAVLTSFSCFCSDSSVKFEFDISTSVASKCGTAAPEQVTSALDVFDRYCVDGRHQLVTTEPTATAGPTPAGTARPPTSTSRSNAPGRQDHLIGHHKAHFITLAALTLAALV